MSKINEFITKLQSLEKKEFQKYLIIFLSTIALLSIGLLYYIYHTSSSLVQQIKKLNIQTHRIATLINKNKMLEQEERKIREILDKRPNFKMNTFFEEFYTKHNIKPETGWKPEEGAVITGTEEGISYQELILKATFKNQTMQKLVTLLQDIYKEPIIYLKSLEIEAEKTKINFELELATKKYKKEAEEE
jgi:hypothetical protein